MCILNLQSIAGIPPKGGTTNAITKFRTGALFSSSDPRFFAGGVSSQKGAFAVKILLVLPAAEHLRATDDSVPKRKMLRFSVLSLTTVAALTPRNHEVTICDENVQPLDFDTPCDVVGVTFMTALAPRAYEIAAEFRRRGKIVVAGGFHSTFRPEEAAEHFDAVVIGEAEGLWPRVLEDIERGRPARFYRAAELPDLAATPIPRRELTAGTSRHYVTTHAVQTGRGCRHGCKFCSITAFARGTHRSRPLEHVLEELKADPAQFHVRRRQHHRRPRVRQAALPRDGADEEALDQPVLAEDRRRPGTARTGPRRRMPRRCSSASKRSARRTSTRWTRASTTNTATSSGSPRFRPRASACRRESSSASTATTRPCSSGRCGSCSKPHVNALQLAILTPQPGTPLYDEFERAGRITDRDWGHYDFRHAVIRPARMTARQLQDGADWLYHQFYRLDRIIVRTIRAVFTVGLMPAYLSFRLNMTYRYDNRREGIVGKNPAASGGRKPAFVAANELAG